MYEILSPADLRALAVFQAAVQNKGFAAAEQALGVRSSTISAQVAGLEHRLGYRLCDRGRAGFRLTERGREVLAAYEKLLADMTTFRETAQSLTGKAVGRLRLGVMDHTISDPSLPMVDLIEVFHRHAPDVHIEIVQDIQSNLRKMVLDRRLDLAVGAFSQPDAQFDFEEITVETQHICCGRLHPWWDAAPCPRERAEIETANWVRRSYILAPIGGMPVTMQRVIGTAANMEAVSVMLQSLPAIGYLPDHFTTTEIEAGRLRRVTEDFAIAYSIGLLSRSGRRDTTPMRRLREAIYTVAGKER